MQKSFRSGEFLFREGQPSHCLFLVKKGTISIRKMKGTAYVEIGRIYANEVLGELSFFDRHPRSAAAIALNDVEVLEIDFDSLDSIWKQVPDYMKTIIASVADRLRKANDTIRRLQKNVITEDGRQEQVQGEEGVAEVELDAAAILAATADVGTGKINKGTGEGESGENQ